MNVTSLLNTSGAAQAVGSRPPSDSAAVGGYQMGERLVPAKASNESNLHNRSRTPWDAGGYSLPLTLNIKNAQDTSASRPVFSSEAPATDSTGSTSCSPKSPHHKFSDSHSSLSSYMTMSSNNSSRSRSHSRISSLSTVSEYQAMNTFISDTAPTEGTISDTDSGMSCPTVVEARPASPSSRRPIEGVAFDNDNFRISEQSRLPSRTCSARSGTLIGSSSLIDSSIADTFPGADATPTSTSTSASTSSPTSSSRAHKRTVSAPDFPSLGTIPSRSHYYPAFGPMAEPTPPKSPQGDDGLQNQHQSVSSGSDFPATPDEQSHVAWVSPQSNPPQLQCMYVNNCETGSQLRKAISHLFGRNKLCTKAIPSSIWVHYCRKHYQRSRYRSGQKWAFTQVDLVVDQINRVQDWSDKNMKANRRGDGFLQYWTLQARRREAKRLQEKSASASRKRPFADDDDDDDPDMASRTAIPDWLEDKLDQQFDTDNMLDIIRDIKDRMTDGEIEQIPDIEILPEIFTDGNEPRPKTTARRNGSKGSGHRHSKSDIYSATPTRSAYPQPAMPITQDHKRSRTGPSPYTVPMPNLAHRPITNMSQAYPFQMNNGFATFSESQTNPSLWSPGSYGSNTVLPAPVSQRNASTPMTPDTNNVQPSYAAQGRSLHTRSVSENPMLHGSGFGYRSYASPPSQGFQQQSMFSNYTLPTGYGLPTTYQGFGTSTNATAHTESADTNDHLFGSYASNPSNSGTPRRSHARLQSTPTLHQTHMQQPTSMAGGPRPLHSLPSVNNMEHNTVPSYFTQPHMSLPSVPKEGGFGQYPQQPGNQQPGSQQHMHLPSVFDIDYTQQSGNQQHMGTRSTVEDDSHVGYNQQPHRRY